MINSFDELRYDHEDKVPYRHEYSGGHEVIDVTPTIRWNGGDGTWNDASMWDQNRTPTIDDVVLIEDGDVTITNIATIKKLIMQVGASFTNSNNLTVLDRVLFRYATSVGYWSSYAPPFSIDRVITDDTHEQYTYGGLVAYVPATGGDFWNRSYFSSSLAAYTDYHNLPGIGYFYQFPSYYVGTEYMYAVSASNYGALPADKTYEETPLATAPFVNYNIYSTMCYNRISKQVSRFVRSLKADISSWEPIPIGGWILPGDAIFMAAT